MKEIKKNIYRGINWTKSNSPALLTGAGLGLGGLTVYLTYKARPKVEKIVEEVEEVRTAGVQVNRVQVGKDLTKALALPVTTGIMAAGAFVWSYNIQNKRIVGLSGALAATQAAKVRLERKIKEKIGEEEYQKMVLTDEVSHTHTDENGEDILSVKDVKADYDMMHGDWLSNSSETFRDAPDYNRQWVEDAESRCTTLQFTRGSLTVNDIRDSLGLLPIAGASDLGFLEGDYFALEMVEYKFTDAKGDEYVDIWVSWPEPKYIHRDVRRGRDNYMW